MMSNQKMIVAQRVLTCKYRGSRVETTVFINAPFEENGIWSCEYGMVFSSNSERIYKIVGEDSLQALQLAIVMLGSTIQDYEGASEWRWSEASYVGLPSDLKQPIFGDML